MSKGQGEWSSFTLADDILSITFLLVMLSGWTKIILSRRVIFLHHNNICRIPETNGTLGSSLWMASVSSMGTACTEREERLPQGTTLTSSLLPMPFSHIFTAVPLYHLPAPKGALRPKACNNTCYSFYIDNHLPGSWYKNTQRWVNLSEY